MCTRISRLHQCLVVCVLSKLSQQLDLEIENSGAIVTHNIYLIINLDSYINYKVTNQTSFYGDFLSYSIAKIFMSTDRVWVIMFIIICLFLYYSIPSHCSNLFLSKTASMGKHIRGEKYMVDDDLHQVCTD
jgi:hypothetical protein